MDAFSFVMLLTLQHIDVTIVITHFNIIIKESHVTIIIWNFDYLDQFVVGFFYLDFFIWIK